MELSELKNEWNKHNSYLENEHRINEKILKKMNLDSSRRELSLPYRLEVIAAIVLLLSTIFLIAPLSQLWGRTNYFISGLSLPIVTLGGSIIAITKIKAFSRIDLYSSSVIQLHTDLSKLKSKIYGLVKFELLGIPIGILGVPAAVKIVHNKEFADLNIQLMFIILIVYLIVLVPTIIWIYKKLYGERIDRAKSHLNEIIEYQNE